jgi:ABC-2 type transport system permease protein
MSTTRSTAAAEWHKLRSIRSTWWYLAGAAALMLLLGGVDTGETVAAEARGLGIARSGVAYFVQFILAGLAATVITSEFATRSVLVTFACTPRRTRVLLAKAVVTVLVVGGCGVLVSGMCIAVAAARFDEDAAWRLSTLGSVLAIGCYLAGTAALTLGIGAVVRRTAGTLAVVVTLLLVVPEVLGLLASRFELPLLGAIADQTPAPAGYRLMAGDWSSGLVLAGWAAAALALGAWALRSRDA